MTKKLPIGISSFEEIRGENYYYVDKTHHVAKLVSEGKYYFLSRPRRFGKSLLVDTLKQAFLGRRELFEGLFLYDHWDWSKTYPVLHLDFGGVVVENSEDLKKIILQKLKENQEILEITCEYQEDYRACFNELIKKSAKKYGTKAVVLIDEYDKPILDRIEERDKAREIREVLKSLYSVLKPLDSYLKFVFITGVTKFSKVSLFSGLNQLNDITLDRNYATVCGYTQAELERVFGELFTEEELQGVGCWYNGYSFCGEPVYNPFDVLLYLQKREFRPFWFETGTPSFLIKLLMERRFSIPELEEMTTGEELISSFDVDFIEPEPLLFQAGYLTVKECERYPGGVLYHLSYPNKEVRVSLNRAILSYYTNSTKPSRLAREVYEALRVGDLVKFVELLKALFASIPYDWYRKNNLSEYEGYYASVVYSFLQGVGFDLTAEDVTSWGRLDLAIRVSERVYLLEFKVVERAGEESALDVLKRKGYAEKYKGVAKEIYLIGIDFSERERNLVSFQWETR
ncbi:MAG: AAA family ATPase [Nitrososphaeria archaeon]